MRHVFPIVSAIVVVFIFSLPFCESLPFSASVIEPLGCKFSNQVFLFFRVLCLLFFFISSFVYGFFILSIFTAFITCHTVRLPIDPYLSAIQCQEVSALKHIKKKKRKSLIKTETHRIKRKTEMRREDEKER